ncbi:5-formaminoimidazole-4-carboxamide-1-(beta)-D-ribofuranosyl 5'-monophosphate synthetase [Vulcanisaeta souniana JCM 11219]|uniref:5-formaminoimidazole-4-carboxamide-1-(beta)-D-ribofuranosyl 5'-monophosphate synthetase n=1 Tax=Vulcanisaeta souniana JCM 11219 TaxID=1293586 RepID=A0A830EAD8_9CREN|nr:5-formaminoimidazole-4-carboxamide-1-(beta)-D-ribofuranosyl 5'-monophosphate synthetase [Vulcanisaeta souniana JCM 11219]GGI79949.1 5-formaminoimidazole-4-carboxamide-1-(beta)-D-ribofuranosyl 5'-monophosphate synthetase [Vulcanisaeta souniana JCM 11219]
MNVNIESIIRNYDLDRVSVATVASHTALQILRGASRLGFYTIAVAKPSTAWFYKRFSFINEVLEVDFSDFESVIDYLIERNTVFIPHGSYVEYVGWRRAISMPIPTFGNRYLIRWEADQRLKMKLLGHAGISIPKSFDDPSMVDGPVIVKLYGAKGGKGYFIARDKDELIRRLSSIKEDFIIQEYVIGVPAYYHYFTSRMRDRVEIMGMDIRYESNVDGRVFGFEEPTFVVVGNLPMVLRESLLPTVQRYGEDFVKAVHELVPPGMIGPFSLESIIRDDMSIVVFEFSGRIVAGTNVYMGVGSPYSTLYFDKPIDMGERIAIEIKDALGRGRLMDIVT